MKSDRKEKLSESSLPRQLKEAIYLNKVILESAGEGIYGLDAEGRTTFVNPAAEQMTGFSAQEMIGKCQHKMTHHTRPDGSDYVDKDCPIYSAFKDGKIRKVSDEVFWRKDGTSFPVEYTSTPIRENMKILGAVVVFRDISQRKKAEEEIQNLRHQLEMENEYLHEEVLGAQAYGEILGNSPALKSITQQIEMVAPTDASVLITGESGVGKELVARAIHDRSPRGHRTMIRVNCASIPKELYESEFFGHVKGAFTGAVQDRAGRFQLADGGTLFLDEIGELPLDLQSKLLRVLQEGTFEKIGDEKTQTVDVRIIAATNRSLKKEVEGGRFREDLYYRLNVFPVEVPALRSRKGDIPILANHFLELTSHRLKLPRPRFTRANMADLQKYSWPGNIRELQNVIERAVITSRSGRLFLNLGEDPRGPSRNESDLYVEAAQEHSDIRSEKEMKSLYRENLLKALHHCKWKITGPGGVAEFLGLKPSTLNSKIKKLNLQKPR